MDLSDNCVFSGCVIYCISRAYRSIFSHSLLVSSITFTCVIYCISRAFRSIFSPVRHPTTVKYASVCSNTHTHDTVYILASRWPNTTNMTEVQDFVGSKAMALYTNLWAVKPPHELPDEGTFAILPGPARSESSWTEMAKRKKTKILL